MPHEDATVKYWVEQWHDVGERNIEIFYAVLLFKSQHARQPRLARIVGVIDTIAHGDFF